MTPSQVQLSVESAVGSSGGHLNTDRSTELQAVQRQLMRDMLSLEDQSQANHRLLYQYTHDIDQCLFETKG